MNAYYNHHNNRHTSNRPNTYRPHRDYTRSIIAAIKRAYRDIPGFFGDDAKSMMSFVNSHRFNQSPVSALHAAIDSYRDCSFVYSDDVKRQMWKILHKFGR